MKCFTFTRALLLLIVGGAVTFHVAMLGARSPVVAEGGKKAAIERRESVEHKLIDLVDAYVAESGRVVVGPSNSLVGRTVDVVAPEGGADISAETMLRVALAQHKLVLVSRKDTDEIVNVADAVTFAPMVTRDNLDDYHPLEFVTLVVHLDNADSAQVRAAMASFTTRNGGTITPIAAGVNCLMICDFVERAHTMLEIIDIIDGKTASEKK